MLDRESTYLALKRADGSVAQMEDFLEPVLFNTEGTAQLGGLTIHRHGQDTWSFQTATDKVPEFHLEMPAGQQPVYGASLPRASTPVVPQPLELLMLGASNGFDPANPCSNMVLQAHGRFLLVDAGPYIRTMLRNSGVGLNQVGALIITHAHEDHAVGLNALLDARQRMRLFISAENAEIMARKLALLNPNVSSPRTLLRDAFDVTVVNTDEAYAFAGMTLRFHHTFHSIPCTGVEVSVSGPEGRRRVLVVGDHDAGAHLRTAQEKGAIPDNRMAQLQRLYAWDGDLVVADAGEGAIHGAPVDFADSPARQVVYVHTGKLRDEERGRFTLARAGHRYAVLQDQPRASAMERAAAQRALVDAFPDATLEDLHGLLDVSVVADVNPGQVVVRQGATDRDLFVLLGGEMVVLNMDAGKVRELTRVDAGEVFGERAAISHSPRAASVVAATPARVMRIPGEAFADFCTRLALETSMRTLWDKRAALDGVALLQNAPITLKDALARLARKVTVAPGSTLIRENSRSNTVYVLTMGRVQVYKSDAPLLVAGAPVVVAPGALIGETAPFLGQARNASIVALDECEVLAIHGPDFKRLVEQSPHLFCHISRTVKARAAA
jgi:CRP-like cAMP-binding protein/glyoxylase-like metal-dependent hydrolase (beta-lactamase superfamily II)